MANTSQILQLNRFRFREKFSVEDWIRIGFIPSRFSKLKQLEDYINNCIGDIMILPEIPAVRRKIISHYIVELEKVGINNQERLLAYIYMNEVGRICGLNLEKKLDYWIFGLRGLAFYYLKPLFYKRKKKIRDLMNAASPQFENYFELVRKKALLLEEIGL
ncbi:hypothetical protein [Desertivirga arenae]|uniref:hypothetical protein n=1 Tax=Desertivirga arenae TaxID=2810309 RepID=UPI001A968B4D|nr:hypothetical protein [Pedobacter sp. SYSU D00823]